MNKTRLIIIAIIVFTLGVLSFGVYAAYRAVSQLTPVQVLQNDSARQFIRDNLPQEKQVFFDMLPSLLGIEEPKTYLVLFQNNTELRPAGGFIGSFGVVSVSLGSFDLLTVQGIEQLDWRTLPATAEKPPQPIGQYLGVPYWYARDANWSPDFAESVVDFMRLYRQEKGPYVDDIDVVVGVTATVLEDVLRDIGPVEVEGKTFTPENAIELLQYDTSFDYTTRGIPQEDRKRILDALAHRIIGRITEDPVRIAPTLLTTLSNRAKEGHVMLYSFDEALQTQFESQGVAGRVVSSTGDYLLWVDANLAALKTDHAIQRSLSYELQKYNTRWLGRATMEYIHTGTFDWRTTRYLTYARVFVPAGSQFSRAYTTLNGGKQVNVDAQVIASGSELGKQWFGMYYTLEPGNTGTVTFEYYLPDEAVQKPYMLYVQKQLGTDAHGLTLDLQFDTTLQKATPAESRDKWRDTLYQYQTDLLVDRVFTVGF